MKKYKFANKNSKNQSENNICTMVHDTLLECYKSDKLVNIIEKILDHQIDFNENNEYQINFHYKNE